MASVVRLRLGFAFVGSLLGCDLMASVG